MIDQLTSAPALPDATRIASVALEVADLARSVNFYTDVIGLRSIRATDSEAALGVDGRQLVELRELPSATPVVVPATGLYHLAILVGSRVELGRSLARLVERQYPLGGASDHLVSEALYLSDPDGNGIEIYRDRPRADWPLLDGRPKIDTLPLDLRALLDDARRPPPDSFRSRSTWAIPRRSRPWRVDWQPPAYKRTVATDTSPSRTPPGTPWSSRPIRPRRSMPPARKPSEPPRDVRPG